MKTKGLTCQGDSHQNDRGSKKLVGRQNNFLFFLAILLSVVTTVVARQEDSPFSEARPAASNLKDALKEVRSIQQGHSVEVSDKDELAEIREEYKKLDHLTLEEALALAYRLGQEFKISYDQLKEVNSGTERYEEEVVEQAKLREASRKSLRRLLAAGLRYETFPEKAETWFQKHNKTWFFVAETIALTSIFVGVDLALLQHGANTPINYLTVIETTLKSFGISASILAGTIVPAALFKYFSSRKKFGRIYEAFLNGAQLGSELDLSRPVNSRFYMALVARTLHYSNSFPGCVTALKRIPSH